jgi:SAM-dependent methyltransferase
MQVHHEPIADVDRYIANQSKYVLSDRIPLYERYLRFVRQLHPIDQGTRILEIGTGTGWFPLLCKANGLQCKGLEISPQLIAVAMEAGRQNGIAPDIELGNIEDSDIGLETYDVIVASSVFEHVEHWRAGLKKAYAALKPGGVLFFESTNKFSIRSGEHHMLFYGWMPDAMRYRFRVARQGKDVMKLGIDFNQFRYPLLRRTFQEVGFRKILDLVDLLQPEGMHGWKRSVVSLSKKFRLVKSFVLTFYEATTFVCVK